MKQIALSLVLMSLLVACQAGDGKTPIQESETANPAEDAAIDAQETNTAAEDNSPEEALLEYDTFVSEEWGFQIDYPRGWEMLEYDYDARNSNNGLTHSINFSDATAQEKTHMAITFFEEQGELSLSNWVQEYQSAQITPLVVGPEDANAVLSGNEAIIVADCSPPNRVLGYTKNKNIVISIRVAGKQAAIWEEVFKTFELNGDSNDFLIPDTPIMINERSCGESHMPKYQ